MVVVQKLKFPNNSIVFNLREPLKRVFRGCLKSSKNDELAKTGQSILEIPLKMLYNLF